MFFQNKRSLLRASFFCDLHTLEQSVCHPVHRGDDDDRTFVNAGFNKTSDAGVRLRVGDGRSAKLHHYGLQSQNTFPTINDVL